VLLAHFELGLGYGTVLCVFIDQNQIIKSDQIIKIKSFE